MAELCVEMFDALVVRAGETVLLSDPQTVQKPWQLFCLLLLQPKDACVPAEELAAALWPREALDAPGKAVADAAAVLNHVFETAGLPAAVQQQADGAFCLNPALPLDVDTRRFEEQLEAAEAAEGKVREQLLDEAVATYEGQLLPQLAGEAWVALRARRYKELFGKAAEALCETLYQNGQHNALLAMATEATAAEPFEEGLYIYIFRALDALHMPRAIIPAYSRTLRLFTESFGHALPQEVEEIYERACTQVDTAERDILVIKDELRSATQENISKGGPLFCTYDVFKYLYQMLARTALRTGSQVVLLLVNLDPVDADALPATRTVAAAMGQVKTAILGGQLRKSDTFTRYSLNQYLIMLSVERTAAADLVVERLKSHCRPFLQPVGLQLNVLVTQPDAPV